VEISKAPWNSGQEIMKLGFGLYRHQLNADHYKFARQCGATHLVIHLVDYFRSSPFVCAAGEKPGLSRPHRIMRQTARIMGLLAGSRAKHISHGFQVLQPVHCVRLEVTAFGLPNVAS